MNKSDYVSQQVTLIAIPENVTYANIGEALFQLAFIYQIEILYLSLFLPVTCIGICLNIVSAVILNKRRFKIQIYSYLRAMVYVGIVGNLAGIIHGLMSCSDMLSIANTYIGQWLESYIYISLYNMSAYAKFFLDTVIVLDRIVTFVPRLRLINTTIKPYQVHIIIAVVTIICNFPYIYLVYEPISYTLLTSEGQVLIFYTTSRSSWSHAGNYGYYVMYAIYFFKHVITFSFEIFLNLISLSLFKKHFRAKSTLTRRNFHRPLNVAPLHTIYVVHQKSVTVPKRKLEDFEKNVSIMVFVNSVTSFLQHIILITFTLYYLNSPDTDLWVRVLQFAANFASVLRHASNFVIFYTFNNHFKKELVKILIGFKLVSKRQLNHPRLPTTGMMSLSASIGCSIIPDINVILSDKS